ncbi:uncharacterized protein A4U43_UnF7050 [Asparagus officinalis]|uniref:Uncharacterized protein n=1 Tax=Asparagus officinalis TaxID=4686 RepID=A0A1R3L6B0_ASPOF|nr:uncharacterized protein A4U43_UnF7050 [Asparagus officinalis]
MAETSNPDTNSDDPQPSAVAASIAFTVAASSSAHPPPQTLTLALPIQNPSPNPNSNPSDSWSDGATSALIDAWGERYLHLRRDNLKQPHWQEVDSLYWRTTQKHPNPCYALARLQDAVEKQACTIVFMKSDMRPQYFSTYHRYIRLNSVAL